MKCLVTGGLGFIGSWVVDSLIEKNHEVIIIDNLSTGNKENLNKKAKLYQLDIRDKKLSEILEKEKPDYVFHLAAQINVRNSLENPKNDADINILGTLNLLDSCLKYKIKKIIFSSTGGAIYGGKVKIPTSEGERENPESPYGIAKLTIEKYLEMYKQVHGLDYVTLRYANVYGPRQNIKGEAGVVALFIEKMLKNEQCKINGSGEQTRDYVFVKDVAKANILALNLSGIFNVGTGIETSVNSLFLKLKSLLNYEKDAEHLQEKKGEVSRSCLDANKLRSKDWTPDYSFDQGLAETLNFYKNKRK